MTRLIPALLPVFSAKENNSSMEKILKDLAQSQEKINHDLIETHQKLSRDL